MPLIVGSKRELLHSREFAGPQGFKWGFVALEYYAVVANRVIAALVTSTNLVLVTAGGPIAAPGYADSSSSMPGLYVSWRAMKRYESMSADSDELLKARRSNRRVALSTITAVGFEERTKWGMGTVPYSGVILIASPLRTFELILLGNQDGADLEGKLIKAIVKSTA